MLKVSIVLRHILMITPADTTRFKIMKGAEQLFSRYGIRSITMDEVARHLSMSKKTIYEIFPNKDELVFQVAQHHLEEDCLKWQAAHREATSALHEMMLMTKSLHHEVKDFNPTLVFDLKRFHPRAWALFEGQRESLFEESIKANLERGQKEGHYRNDLNPSIIARMRFEIEIMGFNPDIFPHDRYPFAEVQMQLLEHFIRGLLTDTGHHAWDELKAARPELALK